MFVTILVSRTCRNQNYTAFFEKVRKRTKIAVFQEKQQNFENSEISKLNNFFVCELEPGTEICFRWNLRVFGAGGVATMMCTQTAHQALEKRKK